jgi:hypothetical protein
LQVFSGTSRNQACTHGGMDDGWRWWSHKMKWSNSTARKFQSDGQSWLVDTMSRKVCCSNQRGSDTLCRFGPFSAGVIFSNSLSTRYLPVVLATWLLACRYRMLVRCCHCRLVRDYVREVPPLGAREVDHVGSFKDETSDALLDVIRRSRTSTNAPRAYTYILPLYIFFSFGELLIYSWSTQRGNISVILCL